MRRMKALLGILVAINVLVNGFMTFAADGPNCSGNIHSHLDFCEKRLEHREITRQHEVDLDNGMKAVCYVYTCYYVVKYHCTGCNTDIYKRQTEEEHSLGK